MKRPFQLDLTITLGNLVLATSLLISCIGGVVAFAIDRANFQRTMVEMSDRLGQHDRMFDKINESIKLLTENQIRMHQEEQDHWQIK